MEEMVKDRRRWSDGMEIEEDLKPWQAVVAGILVYGAITILTILPLILLAVVVKWLFF